MLCRLPSFIFLEKGPRQAYNLLARLVNNMFDRVSKIYTLGVLFRERLVKIKNKEILTLFRCVVDEVVSFVWKHKEAVAVGLGFLMVGASIADGEAPLRAVLEVGSIALAGGTSGYLLRQRLNRNAPRR